MIFLVSCGLLESEFHDQRGFRLALKQLLHLRAIFRLHLKIDGVGGEQFACIRFIFASVYFILLLLFHDSCERMNEYTFFFCFIDVLFRFQFYFVSFNVYFLFMCIFLLGLVSMLSATSCLHSIPIQSIPFGSVLFCSLWYRAVIISSRLL